ncbi:MAG: FAD-dependent monooxygenase [Pseudonocardiales bacterium]|nr:FAD-dependent monooxygenase [Pseudonocardiales bacterium]
MSIEERHAVVVGGGIAGLAAAAALRCAGWGVTVLERAQTFTETDAGLAVTRNGLAALDALGCGDAVRAAGREVDTASARDQDGRWLLRTPAGAASTVLGVHRQRLHAVLRDAAAGADLVSGATVAVVDPGTPGGAPARVHWHGADGPRERAADLVVGADGLRSTVRPQLFPGSRPAYAGLTCWRAVIDDATSADDRFAPVWGPGAEFGALRTGAAETSWYLCVQAPPGATVPDELAAARRFVAGWSPDVRRWVDATRPERLVRHDVFHLAPPLPSYVRGRAVLIGDAAHALVPTTGQGANTALEDGVSLGPLLRGPDLAAGLRTFDADRRPRTQAIARRSLLTQRFGADLTGRGARAVRDAVLRLLPSGAVARAGSRALDWTPPR